MATSNDFLGYNTHILGTVKSVTECLDIVLYNSNTFRGIGESLKISLYNISEVYEKVTSGYYKNDKVVYYYQRLSRSLSTDDFIYNKSTSAISGFNTIIYLSAVDGSPIGYTEFSNIQGAGDSVGIAIHLGLISDIDEGDVKLTNTLIPLSGSSVDDSKTGEELNEYTECQTARKKVEDSESKKRFTTSIYQLYRGESKVDYLDTGFTLDTDIYNLGFVIESNNNLHKLNFTSRNIGYYKGDLVMYSWFDNKFCVTSMLQRNKFGNNIVYTKSSTGYYEDEDLDGAEILYGAGRFMVCNVDDCTKLYDFELKKWSNVESPNLVIDPLDVNSEILELPETIAVEDLYKYLPKIQTSYLDVVDYTSAYTCRLVRKIGNWYILKRRFNISTYLYIVAGPGFTLYATKEDIGKLIFINDLSLLLKEDTYYVLYKGYGKEFWTERAEALHKSLTTKTITFGTITDFLVCSDSTQTDIERIYKNRVAGISEELYDTFLNSYRRGAYPYEISGLPDIVEAFGGILFYKNGYNINYL